MKKILLVDDEPLIREVVQDRLERLGVEFHEASNGDEALQLLGLYSDIGLVISDIKMPIRDGVQLIKEARNRGDSRPFIFFTAFTTQEILSALSDHGVVGFVEKGELEGLEEAVVKGFALTTALPSYAP